MNEYVEVEKASIGITEPVSCYSKNMTAKAHTFRRGKDEAMPQQTVIQGKYNQHPKVTQLNVFEKQANDGPRAKYTAQFKEKANAKNDVVQKYENNTDLPNKLKSGIESLSGFSMDDVKVHYNSSRPAQLQAHAYAQGSDIHLAPGQDKHLPHEAWHVVQQKQGRVKPTAQLKSAVNINDDEKLEREATEMGDQALRFKKDSGHVKQLQAYTSVTPSSAPLQLARYIKCVQNPVSMAGEITRLTAASPLEGGTFGGNNEYGQPIEINKWLSGGAGISTTHYNPGQMQYYSPVGFVLEVNDENILGHFEGDGNTSLLHAGSARYGATFELIRAAMRADDATNGQINAQGYTADFSEAVTDIAEANTLRVRIEHFLANGAVDDDVKTSTKNRIRTIAVDQLKDHYQNGGFQAAIGPGNPDGLADLEGHLRDLGAGESYDHPDQDRDIKYTESQVHAGLAQVVGTFYAAEVGVYPDLIDAAWRADNNQWLNNRANAARQFRQLFIAAGNNGVNVLRLQSGLLRNAPTGNLWTFTAKFIKWALAAVGVAVLYYGVTALLQLHQQYMTEGGHDEL